MTALCLMSHLILFMPDAAWAQLARHHNVRPGYGRGLKRPERQTRRRFRGRHPLCGIGVMSRIALTWNPTACKARKALSRPEPGPLTSMSNVSIPCSRAFLPASSAATCAAYGVDLRLPLKPWLPAEDHAIALPCASVIVITVLLKVAATWATPEVMFFLSLRRGRAAAAGLAIVYCAPFTCGTRCWIARSPK